MASRLARVNAVTVNDVLDGRKLLEIDCVDRVYLTLSVPSLVVGGHQGRVPHGGRPGQRRRGGQCLLPALPRQDLPQRVGAAQA